MHTFGDNAQLRSSGGVLGAPGVPEGRIADHAK